MAKTPERFLWAVELLAVRPTDSILEIGCGAGLLAELIAAKLTRGKLVVLDRSAPMVDKARKRNWRFIQKGVFQIIHSDFSKVEIPNTFFDKVVAFNLGFFRKNPVKELQQIKKALKPQGKLFVLYQEPYEIEIEAAKPILQELINNGFEVVDIQVKKLKPTSALCIVSSPNSFAGGN